MEKLPNFRKDFHDIVRWTFLKEPDDRLNPKKITDILPQYVCAFTMISRYLRNKYTEYI